jgi:uncharacterized membrane protein YbhN (UPF0104 family)
VSRRVPWFAVQALITAVLLFVLFRSLDMGGFRALFLRTPFSFYLLSLAVVLAGQVAYAWRWRVLLVAAGVQTSLPTVIQQYLIGIAVNNFLPSTVGGDVAKVYGLGPDHGYGAVTASVVLDRHIGIGTLAIFAAVALWARPMPAPVLITARAGVTVAAFCALVVLAILAAGTGGLPSRVAWPIVRITWVFP